MRNEKLRLWLATLYLAFTLILLAPHVILSLVYGSGPLDMAKNMFFRPMGIYAVILGSLSLFLGLRVFLRDSRPSPMGYVLLVLTWGWPTLMYLKYHSVDVILAYGTLLAGVVSIVLAIFIGMVRRAYDEPDSDGDGREQ